MDSAPFENGEQILGMPATADRRWTAAEVRALMDVSRPGPRFELVDGELLVTPSPRPVHQTAVEEREPLIIALSRLLRRVWLE